MVELSTKFFGLLRTAALLDKKLSAYVGTVGVLLNRVQLDGLELIRSDAEQVSYALIFMIVFRTLGIIFFQLIIQLIKNNFGSEQCQLSFVC